LDLEELYRILKMQEIRKGVKQLSPQVKFGAFFIRLNILGLFEIPNAIVLYLMRILDNVEVEKC
jgi:hypothetical protein